MYKRQHDGIAGLSKAYDYIQDGAAIYERSFAIIRAEADLTRFSGCLLYTSRCV